MTLPKFLLADNTDYPDAIFVVHTEYPTFIVNLATDDFQLLEETDEANNREFQHELETLFVQANEFYDREISRYEE
ncbi:MAG: hypothetical protein RQ735_10015 [Flavobacteriaceae bacterium]|jgi:hypothetical protein|nr:hypothetical protein [Flavobacteriaceae bacterium]